MTVTGSRHSGVRGEVSQLLLELEAEHHRLGWDGYAALYRVDSGPSGVFHQPAMWLNVEGRCPTELLEYVADYFESPAGKLALRTVFDGPPVAQIFIAEAWSRPADDEWEKDARHLADIPGSIEMRFGVAVIGKHFMVVKREHGSDPTEVREGIDVPGGDALRRIQAASTRAYR